MYENNRNKRKALILQIDVKNFQILCYLIQNMDPPHRNLIHPEEKEDWTKKEETRN